MDTPFMTYAADHQVMAFAVIAAILVIGYLLVMRVFFRNSRELDQHVDLTKMKVWKDDED
jgi:hypothetical protein